MERPAKAYTSSSISNNRNRLASLRGRILESIKAQMNINVIANIFRYQRLLNGHVLTVASGPRQTRLE